MSSEKCACAELDQHDVPLASKHRLYCGACVDGILELQRERLAKTAVKASLERGCPGDGEYIARKITEDV